MYSNTNLKQSLILRSKLVSDQRTLLLHHHLPQHSSVDVWRDQGFDWSESRPPHHQGSIVAFNKRSDHHFGLSFIIYHLERYSVALHDEERDATVTAVPSIDQQSGDYAQPSVRPLSTWNKRQFQQGRPAKNHSAVRPPSTWNQRQFQQGRLAKNQRHHIT